MRILFNTVLVFILCMLLNLTSCRDLKQFRMRNIELTQDINSSGVLDISSRIRFPITPSEIVISFNPNNYWIGLGAAEKFGIRFSDESGEYVEAGYNVLYEAYYLNRGNFNSMPVFSQPRANLQIEQFSTEDVETLEMQIILHDDTIELFLADGTFLLADVFFPSLDFKKIELFAENGKIKIKYISLSPL